MNEWIGRAFRGAIVGAALIAALVVYSIVLAPRIDPRSDRPPLDYSALDAAAYVDVTPVGVSPVAASPEIFAPGEWELESPKTLQTSHGTLFFREYRIEPTGELSVAPITMIFPVEDATGVRNLLVKAKEGGRLRFTEKIDLASGKIGKIEGGRLIGPISMTMEETSPGAGDRFDLTTRDVQIDRKLLSTPHKVTIHYGPHTAIGSDLVINFREDGDEGEAFAAHEALQHVASLELAHVDEVNIDLDAPGLFGDQPADPSRPKEPQGKLQINCTKGFALNLDLRTAQFEENVELNRHLPGSTSDQLTCQRLQIEFDEFPDPANPAAKPKLGAKRIAAIGLPAKAYVRSHDLEAQGNVMSYEVPSRTLSLRGGSYLYHQGRRVDSPEIVYSIPEGNGLGTGTIAGPGKLQAMLDGETPRPVELFWTDQAQLVKQDGEHVVSMVGGARVVVDNGLSSASADRVDFWLKEVPKAERPLAANVPADQGGNPLGSISVKPLRFMAKGRVTLDSPQIAVRTPQLEAWFQELEGAAPAGGGDAGIGVFGSKGVDPAAKRYSLQGDLVRLQMLRRGEEWDLAELFIQGAVDFREIQPPGQGAAKPLAVTSQGLHWRRTPGANETLRIWGEEAQRIPAIVDSESMRLEGPAIDVDRTQSLIQVIGEGRMRLRGKVGSVSPLAEPSVAAPGAESQPQWVTIAWKESFSAAGREATFRQDVMTTTDEQYAVAPTLVARFDRPIDLMNTEFQAPKVESLAFEGGIYSENRSKVSGELRSIDKFQAQSLEIAPESGAFVARGPAWISSVRLGTEGLPGQTPGLTPQIGPKTLQYFYVECQTGFEGDYLKRTVGFIDRTVALFAPAPNWEVQYRPSDGAALPEKSVTLRCDRLDLRHVPNAPGPSPTYYLEADAVGNARLESKQQNADAQKISFNEAKDQIILEGDGRNDVRLESTKSDGSKTVGKMRKVTIWRSENRVVGEDYSGGEYNAANDPRSGL